MAKKKKAAPKKATAKAGSGPYRATRGITYPDPGKAGKWCRVEAGGKVSTLPGPDDLQVYLDRGHVVED